MHLMERDFGAFVDFGSERAGLVHISRLADGFAAVLNRSHLTAANKRMNAGILPCRYSENIGFLPLVHLQTHNIGMCWFNACKLHTYSFRFVNCRGCSPVNK